MKYGAVKSIVVGMAFTLLATVAAGAAPASMPVMGRSSPPVGHVRFCAEHPDDCGTFARPRQIVRLDAASWERLRTVNLAINTTVAPLTDMEIYGVVERWTYPEGVGDCEDYALEKRRELITEGWPASALLITVVRDEIGEGHAVLTVRTDRGDLILDNKTDQILVWDMTPYHFVKRQSARDAAAWDAIDDGRATAVGSLAR